MKKRAFTLIELITVMAVSAILLTLITIPVVQSFNLTRASEAFVAAQSTARNLVSRIEREVSEAAQVRPNHGDAGAIVAVLPNISNTMVEIRLPYAKLDFFPPAKGDASFRGPGGAFINPDTGKEDPTLGAPRGDVNLPASPGFNLVRYWIGLKNPFLPYSNPNLRLYTSTGAPWDTNFGGENLYVLYRAEVPVYIWNQAAGQMVANSRYFELDSAGAPILDDPYFFTVTSTTPIAQQERARAWQTAGRIVTEAVRFDMLRVEYNTTNKRVYFDGGIPRALPLVRFQPRRMSSEPTQASSAATVGQEADNAAKIGPETYSTEMGAWSLQNINIWPAVKSSPYGPGDDSAGGLRTGTTSAYLQLINAGGNWGLLGVNGGSTTPLFNLSSYSQAARDRLVGSAPYPFTQATGSASGGGASRTSPWNEMFLPVVPDEKQGRVKASFDVREVGNPSSTAVPFANRIPATSPNSYPTVAANQHGGIHTGPDTPYQLDLSAGDWGTFDWDDFDAANVGINRRFNKLWQLLPTYSSISNAREQFAKRFIDLSVLRQPGGEPSPLDRRPAPTGSGWQRAQITPGSEEVFGPDQRPGPNYGRTVRYSRTAVKPVGLNQYYINYVDQKEPNWSLYGLSGVSYDPADYYPTDIVSAVFQAQYRAGYLELNSKVGEPLPAGNIYVTYRFQFTEPNDVLAVDYDSSRQIEFSLTVQTYPGPAFPTPQSVTVKGAATVRNFLR